MPYTYPPAAPSLTGDTLTISRFLQSPTLVQRRLRTLAENRFIADAVLTGRYTAAGGSVSFEQNESIFADRNPEAVAPGAEYPLTGLPAGLAALAKAVKWGQDSLVTDESISRQQMDPVNRAFVKLVNQAVKNVDSVALAAIASAVTQTVAAAAAWNIGTAVILRDILRAAATINALNQGFSPDTLIVTDMQYAYLASDERITGALNREDRANPVYTGRFPVIAGVRILPTPNAPFTDPFLVDSTQLGGMADENLAGPGYVGQVAGVQSKVLRDDDRDRWRLRARRLTVPIVQEPQAGIRITGTGI